VSESVQQGEIEQQDPSLELNDELEQLRRDIARQIRSNQRFLENFLDEDFQEEDTG
jgi:hypothetical protein